VAFFAWLTTLRQILTLDNLRKHHVLVVDWCCMSKRSGESMDLLLYNKATSALWSVIFNCFWLSWIMPKRVIKLLACLRGLYSSPQSATAWKMVAS
jgi:hypothetical protein